MVAFLSSSPVPSPSSGPSPSSTSSSPRSQVLLSGHLLSLSLYACGPHHSYSEASGRDSSRWEGLEEVGGVQTGGRWSCRWEGFEQVGGAQTGGRGSCRWEELGQGFSSIVKVFSFQVKPPTAKCTHCQVHPLPGAPTARCTHCQVHLPSYSSSSCLCSKSNTIFFISFLSFCTAWWMKGDEKS